MRRIPMLLMLAVLAGSLIALVACSSPSSSTGGGTSGGDTITLQNLAFNPASLTVKVGATVTFKNDDSVEHHIMVGNDDLGVQQPGETKTWKAPSDGTYMMRCLIHPQMQGHIIVGAGGSTIGSAPPTGGSGGSGGGGGGY